MLGGEWSGRETERWIPLTQRARDKRECTKRDTDNDAKRRRERDAHEWRGQSWQERKRSGYSGWRTERIGLNPMDKISYLHIFARYLDIDTIWLCFTENWAFFKKGSIILTPKDVESAVLLNSPINKCRCSSEQSNFSPPSDHKSVFFPPPPRILCIYFQRTAEERQEGEERVRGETRENDTQQRAWQRELNLGLLQQQACSTNKWDTPIASQHI